MNFPLLVYFWVVLKEETISSSELLFAKERLED